MEFDKSRVYTALNADELKVGSQVIVGDSVLICVPVGLIAGLIIGFVS